MATPLTTYLRMARRKRGLSQDEVAVLLGLGSGASVARHEKGQRVPSLEIALAYEVILGLPVSELFAERRHQVEALIRERGEALLKELEAAPKTPLSELKVIQLKRLVDNAPHAPWSTR